MTTKSTCLGEGVKTNNTPLVVESENDFNDRREPWENDLLEVAGL